METFYMFLITLRKELFRLSWFLDQFALNLQKEFMRYCLISRLVFHTFSLGTLHLDRNIVSWRNSFPFPNPMALMTGTIHTIFRYSCKSTVYCSLFHYKVKMLLILFSSLHPFFSVLLALDTHFSISWFSLWPSSPLPMQVFSQVSSLGCAVIPFSTMLSRDSRVFYFQALLLCWWLFSSSNLQCLTSTPFL